MVPKGYLLISFIWNGLPVCIIPRIMLINLRLKSETEVSVKENLVGSVIFIMLNFKINLLQDLKSFNQG